MATINVEKLSLKDLVELEARVAKALSLARDRERTDLKKKLSELAETHGFTVGELFGAGRGVKPGKARSSGVAKYANPDDRSETWTGRGRKPNWLVARLSKGAKISDFEI